MTTGSTPMNEQMLTQSYVHGASTAEAPAPPHLLPIGFTNSI
jgi:hypothetical protein